MQLDDDHLVAYLRRGGDFMPTEHGYMLHAVFDEYAIIGQPPEL